MMKSGYVGIFRGSTFSASKTQAAGKVKDRGVNSAKSRTNGAARFKQLGVG